MDAKTIKSTHFLIKQYSSQAVQSFEARQRKIINLLTKNACPEESWSEEEIETLLHEIAMMDSNNFLGSCGIGERESRFASQIVARRHYYMGHGIGRSGDITEIQPKAAGSSLIGKLANIMILDLLKSVGVPSLKKCIIVPLATGMGILLCLRTLHSLRSEAKYVLWPRVDQKSCFKCILTAGLIPIIIENKIIGDRQVGSISAIKDKIQALGASNIVCIISTTSSFVPKEPDDIVEIGNMCKTHNIPHVINNAYGIQCPFYMELIEKASKKRVDLFISSTDKNFLVPVGGSIICGFSEEIVDQVGKMYPGRGSGTPSTDIFITLLELGKSGYHKLLEERKEMWNYLKEMLVKVAYEYEEKVLDIPGNHLSLALSLSQFEKLDKEFITEMGSMLFSKFVMGTRLVAPGETKNIGGYEFVNWGMHINEKYYPYLTASATIGIKKKDIDTFIKHLKQVLNKAQKHANQAIILDVHNSI